MIKVIDMIRPQTDSKPPRCNDCYRPITPAHAAARLELRGAVMLAAIEERRR